MRWWVVWEVNALLICSMSRLCILDCLAWVWKEAFAFLRTWIGECSRCFGQGRLSEAKRSEVSE